MMQQLQCDAVGHPTPRQQVFDALKSLPPLPQEQRLLLDLINDEDVDLRILADAIEKCPVVAGRIIGLANAAYFGYGRQCSSVFEAMVNVLGMTLAKNIVLGIVACDGFAPPKGGGLDLGEFWTASVAGAMFARLLLKKADTGADLPPDDAYLGALLRDIGLLALLHVAPNRTSQALRHAPDPTRPALLQEQKTRIGTNHSEVGVWLARQWNLPKVVMIACGSRALWRDAETERRIFDVITFSAESAMIVLNGEHGDHDWAGSGDLMGIDTPALHTVVDVFSEACAEIHAIARLFRG